MYAALIVYASLYPFAGWRVLGVAPWAFVWAPWSPWWTRFDLISNLLGYLPLGALLFGALVRSEWRARGAFAMTLAMAAGLSLAMETLQNFLPERVPSNVDLALNVAGAGIGALLGWLVHTLGGVDRWQHLRERWFIAHSSGGLSLLLLWPVGLLFPAPVMLGTGQVWPGVRDALADWLSDTTVAAWALPWLQPNADAPAMLPAGAEFVAIAFGLLGPCLIAFTVAAPSWRRLPLALGAAGIGVLATTLSTALNFGPQHALAWITPAALAALATGLVVTVLLSWVPRRLAAGLGLMALAVVVALVAQAPTDPYFAESLQAWEQGRFIRFHGAARWVGWLWPYAAMGYLLKRLHERET